MQDDAVLSARMLFAGWFNVLMLRMRLNGEEVDRALIEHPSGSTVLAYDPARGVAMTVRQARAGVLYLGLPTLTEAVAGAVEGDDYDACARREMLEETGVRLASLEKVAQVFVTPSSTTERVHLYLGTYGAADRIAAGGGLAEEGEALEVAEVPVRALWAAAERGELVDAKTFMLLQALRIRRPELFEEAA
jgi:nudix-type nucleoside diphosphatase (YffH/AdpP family)